METSNRELVDLKYYLDEAHDFSLVLGGPLFQLLREAHLEGDHLELLPRRLLTVTAVAWLPLLLLTLGSSAGALTRVSFFQDVEVHVRFLIALPVLVAAELLVHVRIRPLVARFVDWRIVLPQNLLPLSPSDPVSHQVAQFHPHRFLSVSTLLVCGFGIAASQSTSRRGMPRRVDAGS